jgi:hypothetical protein
MFWASLNSVHDKVEGSPGGRERPCIDALTTLLEGAEHETAAGEVHALRRHLPQLALPAAASCRRAHRVRTFGAALRAASMKAATSSALS